MKRKWNPLGTFRPLRLINNANNAGKQLYPVSIDVFVREVQSTHFTFSETGGLQAACSDSPVWFDGSKHS